MERKNFKLIIHPDCDRHCNDFKEMYFLTLDQAETAQDACADLLVFLQVEMRVMADSSNIFVICQKIDGEWCEVEED